MMQYGLIGEKLSHSHSKKIHAMLADYAYEHVELAPDQLDAFLSARAFSGLNVTIPYKRAAMAHCDAFSEEARSLGNVNTLVNAHGRLTGYNTDLYGFQMMIQSSGIPVSGMKVGVLGSGGAGLTACAALQRLGARVITVSRQGPVDYQALTGQHRDIEVLVNATPVGMFPNNGQSPTDLDALPKLVGVLDMIYNPFRTALLLDAEARGLKRANGLIMLIAQAARAAELFTGNSIGPGVIAKIHAKLCRELKNIVLIGMPGCGKSSIGRSLAQRMGRAFVDIDTNIEQQSGMKIPDIFAQFGEAYFRAREREQIAEASKGQGQIIATGGGAVLSEANVRALKQNGELCFIERPLDALALAGRPLSTDQAALERLYAQRLPLYGGNSRMRIQNTGSINSAAQAVEEGFYEIAGD